MKLVYFIAGNTDPITKFSILWKFGYKFRWLLQLRELYANQYRVPWQNILLRRAIQLVQDEYPDYKPTIRVVDPRIIEGLNAKKERVVIVTIHNEISSSIIRALKNFGVDSCLIATSDPSHLLKAWGCDAEIDVLRTSRYVLLSARGKILKGNWIVCCSDIAYNGELLVRKQIFEFARQMEAEIVFALANVSDQGDIEITCSAPALSARRSSTEEAEMFVRFLHTTLPDRRRWRVVD